MNFYKISLGAGLNVDQNSIIQTIRQLGGQSIQTSEGLFSAVEVSQSELEAALQKADDSNRVQVSLVNPHEDHDFSPDMQKLISEKA